MNRETLNEAVKNAEHCAQRVMVRLENNELKGDDDETRTETLATIQKEMDLKGCFATLLGGTAWMTLTMVAVYVSYLQRHLAKLTAVAITATVCATALCSGPTPIHRVCGIALYSQPCLVAVSELHSRRSAGTCYAQCVLLLTGTDVISERWISDVQESRRVAERIGRAGTSYCRAAPHDRDRHGRAHDPVEVVTTSVSRSVAAAASHVVMRRACMTPSRRFATAHLPTA